MVGIQLMHPRLFPEQAKERNAAPLESSGSGNLEHQLVYILQSDRIDRSLVSLIERNALLFCNVSVSLSTSTQGTHLLTKQYLHVFRLRLRILALHRLEIQRRLIQAGIDIGRELRVQGLSGSKAFLARLGSGRDGDGVVVEMRRHRVPDGLVEAVVVAEEYVVPAEAAVVLAGDWRTVSCVTFSCNVS